MIVCVDRLGDDFVEARFESGVITQVDDRLVRYLALSSLTLTSGEWGVRFDDWIGSSGAVDTNDLPKTVEDCQHQIKWREEHHKEGDNSYQEQIILVEQIPEADKIKLQPGRMVHRHDYVAKKPHTHPVTREIVPNETTIEFGGKDYCFGSNILSLAEIDQAVTAAHEAYMLRLKSHTEQLEEQVQSRVAQAELEGGLIRANEPFSLFADAEFETTEKGDVYVRVPDRVLLTDRLEPQIVRVRGMPYYATSAEDTGWPVWTGEGNEYRLNDIFLVDELDDQGLPKDFSVPRVRVEVTIFNPAHTVTRADEEQRLVVNVGNDSFWGVVDVDRLVGNQGYGGVTYDGFRSTEEAKPNYRIVTPGAIGLIEIPYGNQIVVPANAILLGEIKAMFPGMDG